MAAETILQHWILTKFLLPFLLIFFIVYAILEKTKVLGENTHWANAVVALVVALIFVGAVYPKMVVENLILFLAVAMIVVFIVLLLWGFVSGGELKGDFLNGKLKWFVGILIVIAVVIALFWATGTTDSLVDMLFKQSWSEGFWTNFLFVAVIVAVLVVVLRTGSSGGK